MAALVCAQIVLVEHSHQFPEQQAAKHAQQECFQMKERRFVYRAPLDRLPAEIRQLFVCYALPVFLVHRIHHPLAYNVDRDFILHPKDRQHV
jgi:hypothetical protein